MLTQHFCNFTDLPLAAIIVCGLLLHNLIAWAGHPLVVTVSVVRAAFFISDTLPCKKKKFFFLKEFECNLQKKFMTKLVKLNQIKTISSPFCGMMKHLISCLWL